MFVVIVCIIPVRIIDIVEPRNLLRLGLPDRLVLFERAVGHTDRPGPNRAAVGRGVLREPAAGHGQNGFGIGVNRAPFVGGGVPRERRIGDGKADVLGVRNVAVEEEDRAAASGAFFERAVVGKRTP